MELLCLGVKGDDVHGEVIQAALDGDQDALRALFLQEYDYIRNMVYRLTGPDRDTDDIIQNVMLQAIRQLPNYRREASLKTWLGAICIGEVKQHFRRQRRHPQLGEYVVEHLPAGDDPEQRMAHKDMLQRCHKLLSELPDNQRIALTLKMAMGYSVREIADLTDSAYTTTKLRLYYGRKAFFKKLNARYPGAIIEEQT